MNWFDGSHLNRSPAQWDPAKLLWVNAHYIKQADDARLAGLVAEQLARREQPISAAADGRLQGICALFKDRCETTLALADWAARFYADVVPDAAEKAQHVTDAVRPALTLLAEKLVACAWDKPAIAATIKDVLAAQGLKMPQLAMPVRVLVMGRAQTPSLDAVLALCSREQVLQRLGAE